MKSLNWPLANLNPTPLTGWKVELTHKIQDEDNWSQNEFSTQTRFFLNPRNALENFMGVRGMIGRVRGIQSIPDSLMEIIQDAYHLVNIERDYIPIPLNLVTTNSSSEQPFPPGWIVINLDGEGGYYGQFDALPSIEFLLSGGYLPRPLLEQFEVIEEFEEPDSEHFEEVLRRILDRPPQFLFSFLIAGLANYMAESGLPDGVITFMFEKEYPQNNYEGSLSQWNGPDWYDEGEV